MATEEKSIIIRFDYSNEFTIGEITKISGFMKAKNIVQIVDSLNLEANPRSSKTGSVTKAIQESISYPILFPFKTKGILLASSSYEILERNRFLLKPQNPEIEGILDGGHNTLAIGLYILTKAFENEGKTIPGGSKTWEEFKELWMENRDFVENYLSVVRNNPENSDLNFLIPIEILVPRDVDSQACVDFFNKALLEICEARNNNAELRIEAQANQKGYFDVLKEKMENQNPSVAKRIEWKTNDGGDIRVQDLISLAWIPLSLIDPVLDEEGKIIEPVSAVKLYSGKGSCMAQFEKLMSSPQVSAGTTVNYRSELINAEVSSAFSIAVELPELYDYIYEKFPEYYNSTGGLYGRITEVKKMNEKRKDKRTKFTDKEIETLSPEGYIVPLVYGLKELLEKTTNDHGHTVIKWKTNPMEFLKKNLKGIVANYCQLFSVCDYDPQKVGKASVSYITAMREFSAVLK